MNLSNEYSEDEINFIINNNGKLSVMEMSRILNIPHWSIRRKLKKLKMENTFYQNGIDYKKCIIEEYFPYGSWDILFEKLGTQSKKYIKKLGKKFGIKRFLKDEKYIKEKEIKKINEDIWTEEEKNILIENWEGKSAKYISENLINRTVSSIYHKAEKMKLYTSNKSLVKYNKEDMLKDLLNLSIKLGRTPIHSDLISNNLASIGTYRYYFGNYTEACIAAGLLPNFSKIGVGRKGVYLSSKNDICYSLYELIITEFFIENIFNYKKEYYYYKLINDKRCGKREADWLLNNNILVEFWGFPNDKNYYNRMEQKRLICKDNNIRLIEIYKENINDLNRMFSEFI
jgi:predicted hydrocarbon binding protein